jgi:hypothetical protein
VGSWLVTACHLKQQLQLGCCTAPGCALHTETGYKKLLVPLYCCTGVVPPHPPDCPALHALGCCWSALTATAAHSCTTAQVTHLHMTPEAAAVGVLHCSSCGGGANSMLQGVHSWVSTCAGVSAESAMLTRHGWLLTRTRQALVV